MTTNEELNHIQKLSISNPHRLKVKPQSTDYVSSALDFMTEEIDSKPVHLRTIEDWAEIIPEGTKSKVHFTVSMPSDTDRKFKEIMVHYQNKFPLGKVYKHYVISLIVNEVHERMRRANLL